MNNRQIARAEFARLRLSTRTINALADQGICTLDDLGRTTRGDLAFIPGIGAKARAQLKVYVRDPIPTVEMGTLHNAGGRRLLKVDDRTRARIVVAYRDHDLSLQTLTERFKISREILKRVLTDAGISLR